MSVTRQLISVALSLLVGVLGFSTASTAQPAFDLGPRVALDDSPRGAALRVLNEAGPLAFPVAIRVELLDPITAAALDDRIATFERRRLPLWLAVPAPASEADMSEWRSGLRLILERQQSTLVILEIVVDREPSPVAVFAMQVAATEARARRAGVQLALGGSTITDPARRGEIYSVDLAPYVDLLSIPEGARDDAAAWLRRVDPAAGIALRSSVDAIPWLESSRRVVDAVLADFDTAVTIRAWRAADVTAAALRVLTPLSSLMAHPVSALDPVAVGLTLTIGQADVTSTVRYRLLFDTHTFSTYLVYWSEPSPVLFGVSLTLPVEGLPGIHDLLTGARPAVVGYTRDRATGRIQVSVPLTGRPMLVDFNEGGTAVVADSADVSATRRLSISEIISRHQQAQLAQDVILRNYSASARMRQYFRPTVTDAGYDVLTENRYFVEGAAVEWEELSFSVNGSKWGADRPPFPLLQPEKVLSLPLQLQFDAGYAYSLQGVKQVDGFDCYVVQFEPVREDSALYRGTVWIDQRTFARIRVQAVQGGLAAPVVSNEETLRYAHVATIENQPVFLFAGLSARQIVLIAGRNLLVEKDVTFSGFRVNDPGFEEERAAARASDRIMFRETPAGLRHYVKDGDTRVIDESPTSHAKAMAMGVYHDSSYAFPLPIFGINYLDFSLGGSSQTQLALLFGGVLAAGNIQRSNLGSTGLDASIDFFAIAVPSSDRVYRSDGEAESERVLTWPLSMGLNLGWQATPFQRATLQYQLRFDAYVRDRTTATTFQPPSSTITNGIGGAWEYRRAGYNFLTSGTWFVRSRWAEWGAAPAADDTQPNVAAEARTYLKYSVGLSKDVFVGPFQKFFVNAAWFGGHYLDRFVQYQFGLFDDTRIHGVPASGVRFGELAMVRGSYSFNVFEQYRLDLFFEHAWGRGGTSDPDWQPIPGIGVAANFRAPWNTILRLEVGKSVLPDRYRGLGSTTLQLLLLKPLS